jgi:pectinesterase
MKKYLIIIFLLSTAGSVLSQQKRITVAQDGSGDYNTIQEAVNSTRAFPLERVEIYIKNGIYKEKLVIPSWKTSISLIGESKENTVIIYDDHSGKGDINTFTSYTVLVRGNDFYAENLTFENSAGRTAGQAVALHVEGDRVVFNNCKIIGNQDTLYAGIDNSRQYYKECYIEGTTDFIFGPATAVFENCTIACKKNSYITAASTTQEQDFGFVFLDCRIIVTDEAERVYLGRPWRPYAQTVFINTYLDEKIRPEGWHNWSKPENEKTAFYAEYNSTGPGASVADRVAWSKQLTAEEAGKYTPANILTGKDNWNPLNMISQSDK